MFLVTFGYTVLVDARLTVASWQMNELVQQSHGKLSWWEVTLPVQTHRSLTRAAKSCKAKLTHTHK